MKDDLKIKLIDDVKEYFISSILERLDDRIYSFYLVGSYVLGKISLQHPDINFLMIFRGSTKAIDLLKIGQVCRNTEKKFKNDVTVKFEFRPFRFIKPKYENDFELFINPIITSQNMIKSTKGNIFNPWMTNGLKNKNRLLHGKYLLEKLERKIVTRKLVLEKNSLMFFMLPLARAPAQYFSCESNHLLSESFTNAKNIAYFGIEATMSDKELEKDLFLDYIDNKSKMVQYYKDRYTKKEAKMVKRLLEIRDKYLKFKNNKKVAEEVFAIALDLGNAVSNKLLHI